MFSADELILPFQKDTFIQVIRKFDSYSILHLVLKRHFFENFLNHSLEEMSPKNKVSVNPK